MGVNLKPCPSCGSDWCWIICDPESGVYEMACNGQDCDCRMCGSSEQEVYDRINRRTPAPAVVRLLEAARAMKVFLWGKTLSGGQEKFNELCAAIAEVEAAKPEAS
jgi:hypothetical protein